MAQKKSARKGKQTVPSPKAIETTPRSVAEVTPEFEQRENWYTPELADWTPGCVGGRTFALHEFTGIPGNEVGPLVATIVVAPEYGGEDAKAIADLIAAAPALFRHVRHLATYAIDCLEGIDDFNAAVSTMFLAIGNYPYACPEPEELDESIGKKRNACRGRLPVRKS